MDDDRSLEGWARIILGGRYGKFAKNIRHNLMYGKKGGKKMEHNPNLQAETKDDIYTSKFYVAGVKFHKFDTIKDILKEGDRVDLIPEPSNKFDKFAIKIKYNNVMLGYVPKKFSQEVTALMVSSTELEATITQLQPDFEPWTALEVEIREVKDV